MKYKILLVDDEEDIIEFIEYNLRAEGFDVITANDGKKALAKLDLNPDLIILDVMMPNLNGYEVCAQIRQKAGFELIPIVFLTARTSENDEIKGLNIGADDYIKKPISPQKLIARINANLRRTDSKLNSTNQMVLRVGPFTINREKYSVYINDEKLSLPKKEFEILAYFANKPGKVFSRQEILDNVWGTDIYVIDRTIDVHIRKIREKLGNYSKLIETVKGVGYRFKVE